MFYVYGEDLAPGLVGPFDTIEAAFAHIEFQRERGDASVCVHDNARVITEREILTIEKYARAYNNNCSSPEKDRELLIPEETPKASPSSPKGWESTSEGTDAQESECLSGGIVCSASALTRNEADVLSVMLEKHGPATMVQALCQILLDAAEAELGSGQGDIEQDAHQRQSELLAKWAERLHRLYKKMV